MRVNDERGVALILVMVILVLLTFIGLAALSTSSTELFLSSNYRQSREAFKTAEGRLEAALIVTTNFDLTNFSGAGTSMTLPVLPPDTDPSSHGTVSATGTVTYLGQRMMPAGSGYSARSGGSAKGNYFIVDVTGTSNLGATSRQELVLAKPVPGGG